MATVSKKALHQQMFNMLDILTQEQLVQALNFMKFLKAQEVRQKEESEEPFLDFIIQEAAPDVTLQQVREELSSIKGSLSDVIIQEREERKCHIIPGKQAVCPI